MCSRCCWETRKKLGIKTNNPIIGKFITNIKKMSTITEKEDPKRPTDEGLEDDEDGELDEWYD